MKMSPKFILFNILLKSVITVCIIANVTEGKCSRSSLPCEYTCHCTDNTKCVSAVIGQCGNPLSCDRGWSGPKCQRENIALDTRSGLESKSIRDEYWRIYAFDGDLATRFESNQEENPYLLVKLKSIQTVNRLKIVTSDSNSGLISGFRIDVYDSDFKNGQSCYEDPKTSDQEIHDITCKQPLMGQYVQIYVPKETTLILRQMEIYRCADYWFGKDCDKTCNCKAKKDICNRVTGQCDSGCPIGYAAPGCQVCPVGYYGQGCKEQCGHCLAGNACNNVDGRCSGGNCAAGYTGDTCNSVCPAGSYGQGCKFQCGNCLTVNDCNNVDGGCSVCSSGYYGRGCTLGCGHCLAGNVCNKVDGRCPGGDCAAGYRGNTCKLLCTSGYYGPGCTTRCGNCVAGKFCNNVNGGCSGGCAAGYTGVTCKTVCPVGHYGPGCTARCNCQAGIVCNNVDGRCSADCAAGYTGDTCQIECPAGSYGEGCAEQCGNCLPGSVCNNLEGRCSGGCAAGYQGDICKTVCMDGFHGTGCNTQCGHCRDDQFCDKITGHCPGGCSEGFTGGLCKEECVDGYFGPDCSTPCKDCFDGSPCNKTDGSCPNGCRSGNSPISDGIRSPEAPSFPTVYIGVAVLAVLCLLLFAIAVMLYVKLRRLTRLHGEDVKARYANMQMKSGGEETQAPDPVYEEMKN